MKSTTKQDKAQAETVQRAAMQKRAAMTTALSTLPALAARVNALHGEIEAGLQRTLQSAIEIGGVLAEAKKIAGHGGFGPWLSENVRFTDRTARRYMDLHANRDRLLKTDSVSDLNGAYRLLTERKSAAIEAPKQSGHFDQSPEELQKSFRAWFDIFTGYVTLQDAAGKTPEEIAERCGMQDEEVRLILNPRPPDLDVFLGRDSNTLDLLRKHNAAVENYIDFHHWQRFERAARYAEASGRGELAPKLNAIADHYRRKHSENSCFALLAAWETWGDDYRLAALVLAQKAYRAAVGLEEWPDKCRVCLICTVAKEIERSPEWQAAASVEAGK